jgi:hypothetical protein
MPISSEAPGRVVRALTALWAAVTAIHVTIWLLIAVIGGHVDQPWWLYIALPPGLLLAAAWWAAKRPATPLR